MVSRRFHVPGVVFKFRWRIRTMWPAVVIVLRPSVEIRTAALKPGVALYGGEDGLESLRLVVQASLPRLVPGGWLILEFGCGQDDQVAKLVPEYPGQTGLLRYRQLEYYRMPFMSYVALDDPTKLSRADFVRLALVTPAGDPGALPYSASTLEDFEREYCDDRFWGRTGERTSEDTRLIATGSTLSVVGKQGDAFFSDNATGLLGQFRHQYFLLFLIAHFHRASLLSMSDELAVAMNRLTVGDTRSVRSFKRVIRQMMEVFLRFTHRYWFHEVTNQAIARGLFARLTRHLGNEQLYEEVRNEVTDMNQYLDSDSARRQANTILRLTVVTIVGLIGTVASGLLGMNIFAEADKPLAERMLVFSVALVITMVLTVLSVVHSKRLANVLDSLSDTRIGWRGKWTAAYRSWKEPP